MTSPATSEPLLCYSPYTYTYLPIPCACCSLFPVGNLTNFGFLPYLPLFALGHLLTRRPHTP
ncbi:MAG: hypothetical protein ABIL25_05955 [candidate division WOR-3 bacterium]